MKKTISTLLVLTLVVTMLVPTTAFAANSNATKLSKLKLSDISKYDKPVPTNGKKKTKKQINALFEKMDSKFLGKGNTTYQYILDFTKDTGAPGGEVTEVMTFKMWNMYDSKTGFSSWYNQTKYLKYLDENLIDKTLNVLGTQDKKYNFSYSWIKGEKKGTLYKIKRDASKGSALSADESTNINTFTYSVPVVKGAKNYRLYKDAKVLGQKCMVYSYDVNFGKDFGGKSTFYHYISRKTSVEMKTVVVFHDSKTSNTTIAFDLKLVKKSAKFFNPPKNVKFKTLKQ